MDALFQVHRLNDAGQEKAGRIAKAFDELTTLLREQLGIPINTEQMRSYGLMEMHLEIACMFAKKAHSLDPSNQRWNKRQQTPSPQINAKMSADHKS